MERRPVTRETVDALIGLDVAAGQEGLVAPNAVTLAQAAYEQPGAYVWGLWDAAVPVGLMAMVHPGEYPWLDNADDPEAAYLWRLMIAARHQGRGLGRAAVGEAFAQARAWGLPRLAVTVVPRDGSALGFYERLGFARTGRVVDGEVQLIASVRSLS